MITEDYVSFETAKLLKEKGFDVETDHKIWYVVKPYSTGTPFNSITYGVGETTREYSKEHCIPMPTQQMAMKWLREVHNIEICVNIGLVGKDHKKMYDWCPVIVKEKRLEYPITYPDGSCSVLADSSEEAVEEALKYCLTKLI